MTEFATVEDVANDFALSGPVVSVRRFGAGHINETFLVATPGSDYIVQRINQTVFPAPQQLMDNVIAVSTHLGGRLVPQLVAARRGGWLVCAGDDVWRAWVRLAGAATIGRPTPTRAASAAQLLGRFHGALADLNPSLLHETLPDFHDPARRLARLREVVDADPFGRADEVGAEISAAFAAARLVRTAEELITSVPCRVAHNDAKLDNVVFRDGEAVCLVDLDTVMPSAWFWDVGDLVRTACTRAAEDDARPGRAVVDPTLYHAVLDGYRDGLSTGVSPTVGEVEALEVAGAIATYEQALRFLTDWIAGDVYYRTSRPGQNRDRARAQLGLLASMPGTVG
ncbi:MAG: phosphotransferase enzyme family protein [Acidimicrobiia bacterium]